MGPPKSIRYSGDFVIAGFVIAGFVSIYFTEFLPGFQMLFVITGSSLYGGSLKRGFTVIGLALAHEMLKSINIFEHDTSFWKIL